MSVAVIYQARSPRPEHHTAHNYPSAPVIDLTKDIVYARYSAPPINPNRMRCGIGLSPNFKSE